jgi:hypothetical protein
MPLIPSLVAKITGDFPDILFVASDDFHWSFSEHTVYYDKASDSTADLIHEVAHAALRHATYERDVQLIEMERAAWEYATLTLGPRYSVAICEETVEDSLDTYRDWLHSRSTCPSCQATGIEIKKYEYKCLACEHNWRVNDARLCALRRYSLQKKPRS